jgi:hypothetical protein
MACLVLLVIGGAASCGFRMEAVTHDAGRSSFTGYSVDYGDATPAPGTNLVRGESVRFTIRVLYSLQSAPRGRLVLFFEDASGDTVSRPGTTEPTGTAIDIQRTDGRVEATLSHEFTVSTRTQDLVAVVGVYPEGATTTAGALLLKYRVVAPPA